MKTKILVPAIFFMFCSFPTNAQSTPEAFLGQLPAVPVINCSRESSRQSEAISAFQAQITLVQETLSEVIKREKQKNKKTKLSENMREQAVAQSGLSEKELTAVADRRTTQSEKDKLVSKSVQNQTGFSIDEMQKVKNMSKADRQKWAMENYGKVVQNEQQKSENAKPYQAENASMAALAEEQQSIAQNLQHHYSRLNEMKSNVEIVAAQQQTVLDEKLKEIEVKFKDVNDGEGSTAEDMKKLHRKMEQIRGAKTDFCGKLTSLNIDYLIKYESMLKEYILPDLKRQEDIDYQIRKTTFAQTEKSSLDRMEAIRSYAAALSGAYNFYLPVDKE